MGFADLPGFRSGTSTEYGCFDIEERRRVNIVERPLQLMDGTVLVYQGLDERSLAEEAERLSTIVRMFGGTMTLLWHNHLVASNKQRRYFRATVEAAS